MKSEEIPLAAPAQLVASFGTTKERFAVYTALQGHGPAALPAVHAGLRHDDWHVRHWCAIYLDRHGAPASLAHLLPLLHDPVAKVRLWAVHSLACQHCHAPAEIDVIPLLIERVANDDNGQVRKMAVIMLADALPDACLVPVFEEILARESDPKTRLHAARGLEKHRAAESET